jgi:(1->4)-alpha-D-glucan 1-alpha-D-glucosylmutase
MIPRATYRLQFHKDFPFAAAVPLAPYLAQLGISHVYASPILKSRAGSRHGYDVIDHNVIDLELGGEPGFRNLAAALREHDLGIVLDIVPNHMAVHRDNRWWMDVLEHGRESRFADYFDIDWDALGGKVLVPFLGEPYWSTLTKGGVKILLDEKLEKTCAAYFDWCFPLRPEDQNASADEYNDPESLHRLLDRQHFRLAWWRTANDDINWRRFFDISDLIALKQENDEVFEATHTTIFALYRDGLIDGVRIDHIDGLADPATYCHRLRARLTELGGVRNDPHPYIVVEKILGPDEALPEGWAVDGTTGYDFMNAVSALEHDPAGAEPLARLWHRISGRPADFGPEEELARHEILRRKFESALSSTALAFFRAAQESREGRDQPFPALRRGVARIVEHLRVYRTYRTAFEQSLHPLRHFAAATADARRGATGIDCVAIDFIAAVIRGEDNLPAVADAVRRFNQLSSPVAAKAVEDTAFYRYGRLLSRNDVGFNPAVLSLSPAEFHEGVVRRAGAFPHALLATATHDHKRGEDARARLAVLSEIPDEWERIVESWFALNAAMRPSGLDPGDEYQLYQTLVGAWPVGWLWDDAGRLGTFCKRILAWRLKSLHEAKLRTSWSDPDQAYERANEQFVHGILDPQQAPEFLQSLQAFVARIAAAGALNGLVQTTLRCTVPGVPDCYQGTEFWDLSLVDPDNRRAVDYRARVAALKDSRSAADLLAHWQDGQVKQAVIAALLNYRRQKPRLFAEGDYSPVDVRGVRAAHVLAFMLTCCDEALLVAVPLRTGAHCDTPLLPPPDFWQDTALVLPSNRSAGLTRHLLDNRFTQADATLFCRDVFARFPVAVLVDD